MISDKELLEAAIRGLEARRDAISAEIDKLKVLRGGGGFPGPFLVSAPVKPRRKMSAATRKRMAEGQKRRWEAVKAV
jgi:hypothetical protein